MRLRAPVSYKIQYSRSSVQFPTTFFWKDITMVPLFLSLWTMALVEVQGFRTPLPYGTGWVRGKPHDNELSSQGIFHLLCKAFKYAIDSLFQPKAEGNT